MGRLIKVFCKNINRYLEVEGGSSLSEIVARVSSELDFTPICALVNNRNEDLDYPVFSPKQVEFMDAYTNPGRHVYIRSLCMMLYKATSEILPELTLRIELSISKGYYCRMLDADGNAFVPDAETVAHIKERMQEYVKEDIPFRRREKLTTDVIEMFRKQKLPAKVQLLESINTLYTTYYLLGNLADSFYGPLAPSTAHIAVFDLQPYKSGMLMLGADSTNRGMALKPIEQDKLYHAFTDHLKFNRIIQVSNVGELNDAVKNHRTAQLINVAEAMHDKLLGRISDEIMLRNKEGGARVVMIAGPSSSGKTTSCKRLAIQLMTNLIKPKMISLDDYFIDRHLTPRDESGDYDYESLYALDLDQFNKDMRALLEGKTINLPTYSFETGTRIEKHRPLKLEKNDVLLIEGIHGLNPELTATLSPDSIFKLYVSALTTLRIDNHNWISTTDNRLLRRIVRDYKYRHTSALETIRRWPSVRRGEEKWIFPFAENADAMFNSSLIFELGVMRAYAEPLLHAVPCNCIEFSEAYRLARFLSYFEPIPADQIPTTSLLREFLGGSSFRY